MSTLVGSTERAPSTVLSSTGQTEPKTIVANCIGGPMWNSTRNTGSSMTGGIARMNANTVPA